MLSLYYYCSTATIAAQAQIVPEKDVAEGTCKSVALLHCCCTQVIFRMVAMNEVVLQINQNGKRGSKNE